VCFAVPVALTRAISPAMAECELTHLHRETIDLDLAAAQHAGYEAALAALGFTILRLEAQPDLPDSVFVEDAALVLDELAIITRPGAPARRPETRSIAEALASFRRLAHITPPGTLDGGDVLRLGSRLFVGQSGRTNDDGIRQLSAAVEPLGYTVTAVPVNGCLHLKSAVTQVAADTLLINPRCIPATAFGACRLIEVDPREPHGANALLAAESVLYAASCPATAMRLKAHGIDVRLLDISEVSKAEGAVTCCSLLIA
jgi:dimethylargininase